MQGLLAAQTQKRNKNRQQSPRPSHRQCQSQSWSLSPSAVRSLCSPGTHNRTAHSRNHHSSSHARCYTHSHYSHHSTHHHSNRCPKRRNATGVEKTKTKKGHSPYRRGKKAERRAPAPKRKIPGLWSRASSRHRDRARLWGSHTACSLETSRDSSRESPSEETPCCGGEQRFPGRREVVTLGGQHRPMERPSEASQSRGSTWKGLLIITASILSCWIQPVFAQDITIVPNQPFGREGSSIMLELQGYTSKPIWYIWYKKPTKDTPLDSDGHKIALYHYRGVTQTPDNIRQRLLHNGSIIIPDLILDDGGYYMVKTLSDEYKWKEAGIHVIVYGPLSPPNISSSNMAPMENKDNVSLTCQAEGQTDTYRWFINESAPASDRIQLSPDNRTLSIHNVTREDEGPYVCEIENPISRNRSDPFRVNVTYGPDSPMIDPTDDHYSIGENITLNCSAESNPPAQFTWVHNGQTLSNSATLSLTNVSLNDTGTYTCHASNPYTGLTSSKDKTLMIYDKPMKPNITINSTDIIIENDTVVLTCNTEEKDLRGIQWYFQNNKLILNDRMTLSSNNQTLTIMPVKGEDNGAYQCEVWNPVNASKSDSFNLTVVYGPEQIRILPEPVNDQIEVTFNENLALECQANSEPPAQYTWQVNGSSMSENSGNTYTISQASWEHAGTYTCTAMNNVTNATISTSVTVTVIHKEAPSGGSSLSGGAIAGIVIGVLAGVALIGALIYCLFFRKSAGASDHHPTEHKSSAPNHSHSSSDSPPNGTEEVSYASVNFSAQKPTVTAQASTPMDTVYSEIKKK
ncbi:carcinoembryonic antigen-related cell adhesion molecule 1 [Gracilinanus agilis]|uniref:carcinoembryonic antigen-related cell adhesion molecule 1 n=3 Tax=Gracilinanus agilis TaxID=191870 RepID=UPI001CFF4085|nr:carcinoembryonic antigen-related cell adhesion molecule 1 [Gracilinanus agilis]